jgi:DNA-binding NarL/FixJ family response regulator
VGYRIRARACRRPGSGPAGSPLRLIAGGYAYKEIARRLGISPKTVEHHVSSVLRKLQLSSRHELTRWATDRRIV